jgi:hypothetical protein
MEAMKRDVDYFIDSSSTCQRLSQVKRTVRHAHTISSSVPMEKIIDTLGPSRLTRTATSTHHRGDRLFLPLSSFPATRLHCRQQLELSDHFLPVSETCVSDNGPSMPIVIDSAWYVNTLLKDHGTAMRRTVSETC